MYRELLTAGEDVGLATVYRVLTQFENAGLVIRHNFESDILFLNYLGANTMITWCVLMMAKLEFTDSIIEERQCKIAEEAGI